MKPDDLISNALRDLPAPERTNLEAVWAVVQRVERPNAARLHAVRTQLAGEITAHRASRSLRARWRWGLALAAMFTLLVLAGVGLWLGGTVVTTAPGTTMAVVLPDGSHVEVGPASTLRYHLLFSWWHRRVRLDGAAAFEVQPGNEPFVVQAGEAEITVLGTRFTVRTRSLDATPETVVLLEEGRLRLRARGTANDGVVLEAGQMSAVAAGATVPRTYSTAS